LMANVQTAAHLYRIAQEAVGNAFKHGHATIIDIRLGETDSSVVLSVTDNGCGYAPEQTKTGGRGLRTMTVRSKLIGGHFSIHRREGGGMEATCSVPMDYLHA
jgi:two-component system, LuxR family, sensor kinase FixL